MKISIIGAGGVGGYFGGMLARAGQDVTFVARGEHLKAMQEHGLEVQTTDGTFSIRPVQVVAYAGEMLEPDLILLTTKTYDLEDIAKQLNSVVKADTIIITTQNGIDADEVVKKSLKKGQVYPGLIHIVAERTAPGVIAQTGGLRRITFGDRSRSDNPQLKEIETMMIAAGVRAVASDDIVRDLWKKFSLIIPWAGLTSLYRLSIDQVLAVPESRDMYSRSLNEALAVAKAAGVQLPPDLHDEIIAFSEKTAPGSKSSMLVDIEHGRQTEVESLHGTFLRLAHELSVPVPVNEMVYAELKKLQPDS